MKRQPTSKSRPPENQGGARTTPGVLPDAPEYRILVAPHYDERKQRIATRVILETVKTFASFRYELTVEEKISGTTIAYRIIGLNAPRLSLPSAGPARFLRDYDGLSGLYHLSVQGLDGKVSAVSVRIRPTKVEVVRQPTGRSIEIVTDERLWSSE